MSVNNKTKNMIKAAPMMAPNAPPPAGSCSILSATSIASDSDKLSTRAFASSGSIPWKINAFLISFYYRTHLYNNLN